jgi:hypothetical protein
MEIDRNLPRWLRQQAHKTDRITIATRFQLSNKKKTMKIHIRAMMNLLSESNDDVLPDAVTLGQLVPKIVKLASEHADYKNHLDLWKKDQEEEGKNKVKMPEHFHTGYPRFGVTLKYLCDNGIIANADKFFTDLKGQAVGNCQFCKSIYPLNSSRCLCGSKAHAIQYGFCIGDPASPSAKQVKFNPALIAALFSTREGCIHPYAKYNFSSTLKRKRGCRGPHFRQHSNLQKTTYLKEAGHWTSSMVGGMTTSLNTIARALSNARPVYEHTHGLKMVKMNGYYKEMLIMVCNLNGENKQLNRPVPSIGQKPIKKMFHMFVELDVVKQELNNFTPKDTSTL